MFSTSGLSCQSSSKLQSFKWADLMDEMSTHAPTLVNILYSCTETRHPRTNRTATICVCAAILFKFRFSRMNLLQKIISLILHGGHCGKQVCVLFINVWSKYQYIISFCRCMRGFRSWTSYYLIFQCFVYLLPLAKTLMHRLWSGGTPSFLNWMTYKYRIVKSSTATVYVCFQIMF